MRIVVAGGGTGGHIFPAIALVKGLEKRKHSCVLFTDTASKHLINRRASVPTKYIAISKRSRGMPVFLWSFIFSCLQTIWALRRHKPDVVVAFGGYATLPVLIAAYGMRIPIILHEANSILGRVNKLFINMAKKVAYFFPSLQLHKKKHNTHCIGLPIADDIQYQPYQTIESKINILVIGGSQGASILSRIVPEALKIVTGAVNNRIHVMQQCLASDISEVDKKYAEYNLSAENAIFFDDMAQKISEAHIIICRAGASTIAEILTIGRPAIYIPYPYAKDDHQTKNAEFVIEHGAGIMIAQSDLTAASLAQQLISLLNNQEKLIIMAEAAHKISKPQASAKLADLIE